MPFSQFAARIELPHLPQLPESVWLWVAKIAGAILGSAISLAYILPRGKRDAAIRFLVGVTLGVSFGPLAGAKLVDYLDLTSSLSAVEIGFVGATTASLCAWWGLGVVHRFFSTKTQLPKSGAPKYSSPAMSPGMARTKPTRK